MKQKYKNIKLRKKNLKNNKKDKKIKKRSKYETTTNEGNQNKKC